MIRGLLRGSTTVVELGSSLGVTSTHIAALMPPGVCIEANPRLLPGLRERLTRRTASLQVDFVHAAIAGHYDGGRSACPRSKTADNQLAREANPQLADTLAG